ncbi:MAG: hypothetical protein O2780_09255 [Proteobacteria bacterium]|nr:hypothetical protein [Pseudomonadota bacterium]
MARSAAPVMLTALTASGRISPMSAGRFCALVEGLDASPGRGRTHQGAGN